MARRRDYAKEYRDRNARAKAEGYESYGQKRYQTQIKPNRFKDLESNASWRRAVQNRHPTPQVADWFRMGFLTTGEADEAHRQARGNFLSWVVGTRPGRGDTKKRIIARAKAMGNKSLGQIAQPDFNWKLWREDYKRVKEGAA